MNKGCPTLAHKGCPTLAHKGCPTLANKGCPPLPPPLSFVLTLTFFRVTLLKVPIRVHISFPHLSCTELAVDYSDTRSDDPEDATGHAIKKMKSKFNRKKGEVVKRKMSGREKTLLNDKGFGFVSDEGEDDKMKRGDVLKSTVGCTVEGVISAGLVGGNFKITLTDNVWGQVAMMGTGRVAQLANVSHFIHELKFGNDFPLASNPLEGLVNGVEEGIGLVQVRKMRGESAREMTGSERAARCGKQTAQTAPRDRRAKNELLDQLTAATKPAVSRASKPGLLAHTCAPLQFFMKVIPTAYSRPYRGTLDCFQISMTEQFMKMTTLLMSGNIQQPGITFAYDYGAMVVNHVESREGLFTFLGSVCAVTGGVFVSVGLFYSGAKAAVGGKKID